MKNNGLLWALVFSWFSWILQLDLMLKQTSGSIFPTNQIVRDNWRILMFVFTILSDDLIGRHLLGQIDSHSKWRSPGLSSDETFFPKLFVIY